MTKLAAGAARPQDGGGDLLGPTEAPDGPLAQDRGPDDAAAHDQRTRYRP